MLDDLGIDIAFRHGPRQIMCHCPNLTGYHKNNDANPSAGFNEEKLAWNCFVCGGGNVIELVQMMKPELAPRPEVVKAEGRDEERDAAAVKYLEQFADVNIPADDFKAKIQAKLNPPPKEEDILPDYPTDNLFQYRKIHPYLYERGLSKPIIQEMQIGFDDEHLGITIPHFFMGKLVGMQRRHLAEDETGYRCPRCELDPKHAPPKRVPKYKNTPHFPKVNTLYGYDRMKEKLKEEGGNSVIVVESPMTALRLMSLGFNRVVASFGQWSTEQSMLLIAVPTVYFWPDNDGAGMGNAKRAIETLGKFVDLRIVPAVPKSKGDAADLADADEVLHYLKNAYPASLFKMHSKDKLATIDDLSANTNTR